MLCILMTPNKEGERRCKEGRWEWDGFSACWRWGPSLVLSVLVEEYSFVSLSLHKTAQITWAPRTRHGTRTHEYIATNQIISRKENNNATSGNSGTLIQFWRADWLKIKSTACSTCLQLIFIPTCGTSAPRFRVCRACYLVRKGRLEGRRCYGDKLIPSMMKWQGKALEHPGK